MTLLELRQIMEGSVPWYFPIAFAFAGVIVYIVFDLFWNRNKK